jgi:hypothetical protein
MHVLRPFTHPIGGWQQTLKHEVEWVNTHQSKLIGRPHYIVFGQQLFKRKHTKPTKFFDKS